VLPHPHELLARRTRLAVLAATVVNLSDSQQ
jgi:hypothetical protein